MLFNSLDFILFFLAVYGLYLCLPFRAQNRMLLAASYLFYGCWDWRFLGLIWLSSTLDFFAAQAIRDGDFTVPAKKLLAAPTTAQRFAAPESGTQGFGGFTMMDEDDGDQLPF